MMEQLQWYRPEPLDVLEIMERGTNSQEKISQVCYCCCFVVVCCCVFVWCSCCLFVLVKYSETDTDIYIFSLNF